MIEAFSYNSSYAQKGIDMWSQVCEIQEPHTLNDLLTNLCLLFGIPQGSTQETAIYLGKIRNLISQCKSGEHNFYTPLVNMIVVQRLDPP